MAEGKNARSKGDFEKYGLFWNQLYHPVQIELEMIRRGGTFTTKDGRECGKGLFYHYKALQDLLWPTEGWHKWRILTLESFVANKMVGILGPASSAKTHDSALWALCTYYAFSDCCSVLCSSTTEKMLKLRIWGELTAHHRSARQRCPFLPGQLTEGALMITTDERRQNDDGRDFRNGIVGIATRIGQNFQGISNYVGVKNKIVILLADELALMPPPFLDSVANLKKNEGGRGIPPAIGGFHCIGIGNPKDVADALGKLCEPAASHGGWEGAIDQTGGTKTWPTRFSDGICIQLVGSDSPNMDVPEGTEPPFPYLITRKAIDDDIAFYGKDSLQFTMMDEGRMPRGQANRRVLTRQMCIRNHAMEEPIWQNEKYVKIGALDAAYRGVGGDRCMFTEAWFGNAIWETKVYQCLALMGTVLVPIVGNSEEEPEDQIAGFVKTQCAIRGITPENFFFDSTGRGTLMNAFARLWSANVQCVEFGGPGTERMVSNEIRTMCKDYYFNFVSELWFSVRLGVESKQLRGMTEEVIQEFAMREWGFASKTNNKIQIEPKDKTKLRMGRSPDIADSVCTAIEGARRRGFVIQKLATATAGKSDAWKQEARQRAERLQAGHQLNYAA